MNNITEKDNEATSNVTTCIPYWSLIVEIVCVVFLAIVIQILCYLRKKQIEQRKLNTSQSVRIGRRKTVVTNNNNLVDKPNLIFGIDRQNISIPNIQISTPNCYVIDGANNPSPKPSGDYASMVTGMDTMSDGHPTMTKSLHCYSCGSIVNDKKEQLTAMNNSSTAPSVFCHSLTPQMNRSASATGIGSPDTYLSFTCS